MPNPLSIRLPIRGSAPGSKCWRDWSVLEPGSGLVLALSDTHSCGRKLGVLRFYRKLGVLRFYTRLGTISCRGDVYLRTLLIQGARSSLQRAKAVSTEKATPEQLWIGQLAARMPFGKVLVAIANKHARQLWTMLARDVDYDPSASLRHTMRSTTQPAIAAM